MAQRYPKEFRDDVVKVARLHQAPMTQIAKDFGISAATLYEWIRKADIDDGARPGAYSDEVAQSFRRC